MVIFLYNLYIFGIHFQTVLYPKPCNNEPFYKEVKVYLESISGTIYQQTTMILIIQIPDTTKISKSGCIEMQLGLSVTCNLQFCNVFLQLKTQGVPIPVVFLILVSQVSYNVMG